MLPETILAAELCVSTEGGSCLLLEWAGDKMKAGLSHAVFA
jgi:hypothetical protein